MKFWKYENNSNDIQISVEVCCSTSKHKYLIENIQSMFYVNEARTVFFEK